jgi:hypothetical protein
VSPQLWAISIGLAGSESLRATWRHFDRLKCLSRAAGEPSRAEASLNPSVDSEALLPQTTPTHHHPPTQLCACSFSQSSSWPLPPLLLFMQVPLCMHSARQVSVGNRELLVVYIGAYLRPFYSGCNTLAVSCYAAAGFTFGTVAVPAAPAAILGCNSSLGICSAACATVALGAPTP